MDSVGHLHLQKFHNINTMSSSLMQRTSKADRRRDGTPQHARSDVVRSGAFRHTFRSCEARCMFFSSYGNVHTRHQPCCVPSMESLLPKICAVATVAGLSLYARSFRLMIELMMAIPVEHTTTWLAGFVQWCYRVRWPNRIAGMVMMVSWPRDVSPPLLLDFDTSTFEPQCGGNVSTSI